MIERIRRYREWWHELTASRYTLYLEEQLRAAAARQEALPVAQQARVPVVAPRRPVAPGVVYRRESQMHEGPTKIDEASQGQFAPRRWQQFKTKAEAASRKRAGMSSLDLAKRDAKRIAEAQENMIDAVRRLKGDGANLPVAPPMDDQQLADWTSQDEPRSEEERAS